MKRRTQVPADHDGGPGGGGSPLSPCAGPCPGPAARSAVRNPARVVEEAIRAGQTPGAVVVVGNQGQVVFSSAFGRTGSGPKSRPPAADTLYDIASLTKVVATTPAILQLVEQGRIGLDDPAVKFWPEFRGHGKERITVRELLTHYSGLRPGLLMKPAWSGYEAALNKIAVDKPAQPSGSQFIYSDLNFIVLGEIVRRVSGEALDVYCRRHIFELLGMKDTGFKPAKPLYRRLAPTMEGSFGVVHDPDIRRMGGIAGPAGLFATADDLARFAQAILDQGRGPRGPILSPASVELMRAPGSPAGKLPARGLGWAIHSPAGNWSDMLPAGSFGHKGGKNTMPSIPPFSPLPFSSRFSGRGRERSAQAAMLTSSVQSQFWKSFPPDVLADVLADAHRVQAGRVLHNSFDFMEGSTAVLNNYLRL